MVADEDAYNYFQEREADVCFPKEAVGGTDGIMAYNRTDQEKGKATVMLPVSAWIVAIGQHPGLVPSKQWIKVQESLDRKKTKAYRKPRNNEALLTGLLFCSCGDRMYPKLSQRKTADGKTIYTYVCKMKERNKWNLRGVFAPSGIGLYRGLWGCDILQPYQGNRQKDGHWGIGCHRR